MAISTRGGHSNMQLNALRGYAKASKGGAKPPPRKSKAMVTSQDTYKPASVTRTRHRAQDPVEGLTVSQRAFLQELVPDGAPLRSLRQMGWDLSPRDVVALMHASIDSKLQGERAFIMPLVGQDMFQSAEATATIVKECLEDGFGFPSIQSFFVQVLNAEPSDILAGIKIQVKGRLRGKGGKAAKKAWQWGATSVASFDDPVDFSELAAVTRAGTIGVKVWLIYKRDAIPENWFTHRNKAPPECALDVLLAQPRPTPVRRARLAWWAVPAPLQPVAFRTWEALAPAAGPQQQAQPEDAQLELGA